MGEMGETGDTGRSGCSAIGEGASSYGGGAGIRFSCSGSDGAMECCEGALARE